MPRVIGIPPCRGAFGTLVYYYMNGRWYVRSRPIISKESIYTKESRKRHRENMTEFGFASHVGRKIREAWGQSGINATGPYTSGRLNKEMLALLRASEGTRGKRSVQLTTQGHRLEGFEFDEGRNPDDQFTHTPTVTTEYEGDTIRIHLKFPRQARHNRRRTAAKNTHFTLYLNAVVISDHHAITEDNHHQTRPNDPEAAVYTATTHSEPIEIAKDDRLPGLTLHLQVPLHSHSNSHCRLHSHSNSNSNSNSDQTILISYGLKYTIFQNGQHTTPERGSTRSKIIQHDAYMRVIKAECRPQISRGGTDSPDSHRKPISPQSEATKRSLSDVGRFHLPTLGPAGIHPSPRLQNKHKPKSPPPVEAGRLVPTHTVNPYPHCTCQTPPSPIHH